MIEIERIPLNDNEMLFIDLLRNRWDNLEYQYDDAMLVIRIKLNGVQFSRGLSREVITMALDLWGLTSVVVDEIDYALRKYKERNSVA